MLIVIITLHRHTHGGLWRFPKIGLQWNHCFWHHCKNGPGVVAIGVSWFQLVVNVLRCIKCMLLILFQCGYNNGINVYLFAFPRGTKIQFFLDRRTDKRTDKRTLHYSISTPMTSRQIKPLAWWYLGSPPRIHAPKSEKTVRDLKVFVPHNFVWGSCFWFCIPGSFSSSRRLPHTYTQT